MRDVHGMGELSEVMETLQEQLRGIADFEQRRAELTATATALDGAVQVTVNSDGQVTDTYFADDISWISPADLGAAVTAAARAAAVDVAQRTEELQAPLLRAYEKLPTLSELVAGVPVLDVDLPALPRPRALVDAEAEADNDSAVPFIVTRPVSEVLADPDEVLPAIELSDAEAYDQIAAADNGSKVSESGWG